jgi:hypothetical protein
MPYYMRYFVADPRGVSIADLRTAVRSANPNYDLPTEGNLGELHYDGAIYGKESST